MVGLFNYVSGVFLPFECVADVGAKEFVRVCNGCGFSGDVEGCLVRWVPSEVCDEFLGFGSVELEVVVLAPGDCLGHLFTVVSLIIVGDESGNGGVIGIFIDGD